MHIVSTQSSNYNYFVEEGTHNVIDNCLFESNNTNLYYQSNGGSYDIDHNSIINSTILNTSSAGYNIWLNGDADNDTIRNCTITSSGTGGAKAVYLTDRSTGLDDMWPTTFYMFNNTVTADDYGVYANVVDGNTMETFNVNNNFFNIQSSDRANGASIYLTDHGLYSSDVSNIFNNRFKGGTNGIYLTRGVDYVHFYNNYFTGNQYGIYVNDNNSDENELQHNSFYTSKSCVYFYDDSKAYWYVRDNIFYTTGNSSYYCLYAGSDYSTFVWCDYNVFYAPNGANIAYYSGSYSTLASWQGVNHHDGSGNGDTHSFNTNPSYLAPANGNLDLTANYQTGTSIGSITTDIHGTTRTHPTIGAFEEGSELPVEISKFNYICENNTVILKWTTQSEINNDYFTIEKSSDGINFKPITKIAGNGNSNFPIVYEYKDLDYKKPAYYRLSQTDFNETMSQYNKIIYINCENKPEINIYPNPSLEGNSITIDGEYKTLKITDFLGRQIKAQIDNNKIFGLAKGAYIFDVDGQKFKVFVK